MNEIYKKLAAHLNNTPGGFPATETGVELRILKRLFTEEEAETATHLIMIPETVETIAKRAGRPPENLGPILKDMAQKGLIFHSGKGGIDYYMTAQFVVGIWEYQVNRLTKELIKDFNEYVPYLMKAQTSLKIQQLRVVPISKSITADMKVMDYEEAEKIIRSQSKIVLSPCICRTEHEMIGKGCGKLKEACFTFGGGAYYYEERGIGRSISQEEALKVLHRGIDQGLVLQPGNSMKPMNICMCCDCCCQILKNIKKSDKPATLVNSSYFAQVNEEECTACTECEDACPMDAVTVDETASVNMDRCIGCGLCTAVCEFNAIHLVPKEEKDRWVPPGNTMETYINMAKEKGLL